MSENQVTLPRFLVGLNQASIITHDPDFPSTGRSNDDIAYYGGFLVAENMHSVGATRIVKQLNRIDAILAENASLRAEVAELREQLNPTKTYEEEAR